MLAILLFALAQIQLTTNNHFVVGDPIIEDGYVYFQASTEVATVKESNDVGTLYAYAHTDPEFTFAGSQVTETLTLPSPSVIISGALSRVKRPSDNAWLIAVGDKEGHVYVWRIQTDTPEYLGAILIPNPHKITSLSFSYQCTKLLIGSEYGRVFRYDLPMNPWTLAFVNEGWHPRDDGYTNLYPIRVRLNGGVTERNLALRYGPGKILQLTALGTTAPYDALIVHATAFPATSGVTARDADLWVLTKNIDITTGLPVGSQVTFIDLQGTTDYIAYSRTPPVPQKTQPLVFMMDTPYTAGTLGRTPMTCISINDIDYYKLNLNDVYTAVPTGANFFYRENLEPGVIRYWGAYRSEYTTSAYNPPNQTYKYIRTQITPDACDGVTYALYNFRSVVTGNTLETEPPAWTDDTISYDRCDGLCPDFDYLTLTDGIAGTGYVKFLIEKWVKGAYYLTDMTYGYNQWIFKETESDPTYNTLYLVDNYQTQCSAIPDLNCVGAVIVDINLLNETNPYETMTYAAFVAQSCNPYCLEFQTDYTTEPILNLSVPETDYVRVEQELLRGMLGFQENRWSEEFSITNGAKRPGSLAWNYGTWTTEWPTGKGFDVAWYRINLEDPNNTIESTTTPLTEALRKPGQIGPTTREYYYKSSDGFYAIINDDADDPIILVPGTIDMYDIVTKEKPFVVFKAEVGDTSALIGTSVPDLVATLVHYDGVYTYFLSETVPNCVTFDLNGTAYDCTFMSGDNLRFFEYAGALPPGIFPDCLSGQDCIDTSTAIVNLFQSDALGNGYFIFGPDSITQDHCGISGPGLRNGYDDLILILIPTYTQNQLDAADLHIGEEVTGIADDAILCGVYPIGNPGVGILTLFFLVNGTVIDPGTFDLTLPGPITVTYSYTGYSSPATDVYPTLHTDLAPEICIADDCFSGGTDCIDIPADSYVSMIPTAFKESNTWDDGYTYALTAPGILNISAEHCFTGGIAYPGRSGTGKYIAQQTYTDNTAAQTAHVALLGILDSGIGTDVAYTGGSALLVNAVRIENKVYTWMLCSGTMPGISTVITYATYPFTNSVYSPNEFSCWTWAASTRLHSTTCKSSSTQVYKLDQDAQEYEGELISSKTDLLGYDEVIGTKTYTYTDETVIDIPWAGKFYDMMYLGPNPDYEILTEVPDPHYVIPQFTEEGEQMYEEVVEAGYVFAKADGTEGEVLHYEGEDVYVGAYGFVEGTPAELWVMEGEATEGEICAVPECSESGTDCQPFPTTHFFFSNEYGDFISMPGSEPFTENHCGLGPLSSTKQREHLTYTISNGAADYSLYVDQLGSIRNQGTYEFMLVWVEVSGANLILGIVCLVDPGEPYLSSGDFASFVTGKPVILVTSLYLDIFNRYDVFSYDFGETEIDQLCVLGPYPTRNILPGSVPANTDTVYRNITNETYVLSSINQYDPRSSGIGSTMQDPYFYGTGTDLYGGVLANGAVLYDFFERLLGRDYDIDAGQYFIFQHLIVNGPDLELYFMDYGGVADPVTNFYQNTLLTVTFAELGLTELIPPVCETYLLPDAILLQTNYTGAITTINEYPTVDTTNMLRNPLTSSAAIVRVSFSNLTNGCSLTGTQTFRVYLTKSGATLGATVTIELVEAGVAVTPALVNAQQVANGDSLVTATWNAALVSNPNDVQIRITTTRPTANNIVDIRAVHWIPTTVAAQPTDLHVYEYARDRAPQYLAEAEQAGAVYSQTYLSDGQGYIFSTDKGLPYTVGLNGTAFPDHEKVYIDYVYTSAKVSDLMTLTATPSLGWNQVVVGTRRLDHVIAGYSVEGTILRVYFLVSPTDTLTGTDAIALGGTFEAKTSADRIVTEFQEFRYDTFTGGNPESLWNSVPYPDEYYGWDCIDLSDTFFYRNFLDGTWILTSDETFPLSEPYQTPIWINKAAATAGTTSYSRVYGPYSKIEYEARYEAIVNALGTNLQTVAEPVVITHIKKLGSSLEVFYLIDNDMDTGNIAAYTLGDYAFPMSLLEANNNFDLVGYDYPVRLDRVCKDICSKKIECTTNFTISDGKTSSTVDLRDYTGLSEVIFGTSAMPLYHNLIKTNSPAQYLTYPALIYSSAQPMSNVSLTDNTFRIEYGVDSILYKDLNMFGTWLNSPIYEVDDLGAVTDPRLNNFVLFYTEPIATEVADILSNSVGSPILLNNTEYGVLTYFSSGLLWETIGVGIYETWSSIPADLTVSLVEEPDIEVTELTTSPATPLYSAWYKFVAFDSTTELPLGKDVISAVGSTTINVSLFYKETSTRYWGAAYALTSFPASAANVTVIGTGSVPITNYSATQPTNNLFRPGAGGGNNLALSNRYTTPITLTYNLLDADLLNPPTFSKIINTVTYTDPVPFVGETLNFSPSVPTLGYAISVEAPTYLRFDPRLQTVSTAASGEALSAGDIYVSATEVAVTDVVYVNFGVTEDVSEASPGYQSLYVGDDVHRLTSVRGKSAPITYADEGYCTNGVEYNGLNQADCELAWSTATFDKEDLYAHTYAQDDYTVYLKDGTLYARPSVQYVPSAAEWIVSEPEAFDIAMEWIDATEPVKEFFRVYLGVISCAGGEWTDPLDIPEECENVMDGLDVPALLEAFDTAYSNNVLVDEFVIANDVQKFWVVEDASHLGLDSFMTEEEFMVIADGSTVAKEIWYDQTKPVGYDYYPGNANFYNQIRIDSYLGLLRSLVPKNVALACLRMQVRDWQRPNIERLAEIGDLRASFIDNFVLSSTNGTGNWGLINIMEPVAFQAPRVVYLTGGGEIYTNNVWGTMPKLRLGIQPHVGEYLIEVVRSTSNTLVLLSDTNIYYGKLVSDEPLSITGTSVPFGAIDIESTDSMSNNIYVKANVLDPWASGLYKYTVPSIEGTVYLWPREFMSTEGRPWDDPPGYLIVCP